MSDELQTLDQDSPISLPSVDRVMTEVEPLPAYSVVDNLEQIIEKELQPIEQEIIETKCFTWTIEEWSKLDNRTLGPTMQAGGLDWNVLLFPRGNNASDFVAIYLDLANAKGNPDVYACAQFIVCLSKPSDPTKYVLHSAQHRFNSDETDWGFTRFTNIEDLINGPNNLLENDSILITTVIRVVKDPNGILWHKFINYDSKKVTGCVGLQNQGATCYMNSLFQSLYFTNLFRKAVYQIPTEDDEPTRSVALALQRVFYNLQFTNTAVGTTELTKSFGWDSFEAFRQHDVQEFNRVLQDNLEIKMKGTPADGAIKELFVGRMKSYIKCINVTYESSRLEDYYDIQLNVKGCKNLEDSFRDYVAEEILEGENKYMAEGHGLQDAKKGVIFESFPPVLHLQLKRFEYDMMRDMMIKINDRHEFPTEIDLEPYLSENADKSKGHKYKLHGVLVHSGDLTGGHYFAFVKPEKEDKWFKFDDDRVTPATLKEVLEENYGGEQLGLHSLNMRPNVRPMNRFTNAYMLVYIRECMLDEVLAPVTSDDIPKHLGERLEAETRLREAKRREKEEQHLYTKVLIADDETFRSNTSIDFVNFDEKDAAKNRLIATRTRKDNTFGEFKESIANDIGLDPSEFRFWILVTRQNRTVRIDTPIPDEENYSTIEEIRTRYSINPPTLRLYLERASVHSEEGFPLFPPQPKSANVALIFIKLFSPELQKIQGIGHVYAQKDAPVSHILGQLRELAGFAEDQEILVYEEIKSSMIDPVDINITITQAELQDGDILCIQKQCTPEEQQLITSHNGKVTVDAYLIYETGKVEIAFGPVSQEVDIPEFKLMLHRDMTYDQIALAVGAELQVDPTKLRIVNPYLPLNKAPPKRFGGLKLGKVLSNIYTASGGTLSSNKVRFLYEKLDVSLDEIESKCPISVVVCAPTLKDIQNFELLMSKDSELDDFKKALVAKGAKLNADNLNRIRVFDRIDGKFCKEFNDVLWKNYIANRPQLHVCVEYIPEEELEENMGEDDEFINVFNFQRTLNRTHSIPFKFLIKPDEPISETKKRLQSRTGLDDNEWSKVKINIISDDDDNIILVNDADDSPLASYIHSHNDQIGLDHIDKNSKVDKTGAIFIRG